MIHFLRNKNNRNIIECEVYKDDLSSSVNIENYSSMLLDLYGKGAHHSFISEMSDLDEIRGWWWEQAKSSGDYKSIDDFVREKFLMVAEHYDLNYITD
jgi:hypothetical protein